MNDWKSPKINLFAFLSNIKTYTFIEKSKRGKIVNISSIFGKISKEKGQSTSTKSGLAGLNRGVALDLKI